MKSYTSKYVYSIRMRAFTLLELLVVMAMVSLLATVILASLNQSRDKAHDSKVFSTFREIKTEAEIHHDDQSFFCNRLDTFRESIDADCAQIGIPWSVYAPLKDPEPGATGLCLDSAGVQVQILESNWQCEPTSCTGWMSTCMPF